MEINKDQRYTKKTTMSKTTIDSNGLKLDSNHFHNYWFLIAWDFAH